MTSAQTKYRKDLIRHIHTSPRWRNHYAENRDAYVELLRDHFGKATSKALSITELLQLNSYMQMERSLPLRKMASPQQLFRLGELWSAKARTPTDAALLAMAARICGRVPDGLPDLSGAEAQKLIVALDKMK